MTNLKPDRSLGYDGPPRVTIIGRVVAGNEMAARPDLYNALQLSSLHICYRTRNASTKWVGLTGIRAGSVE